MGFDQILGQARTKAFLRQLADNDRVPHALLFLGATGSGTLALAVAFAQFLQCEKRNAAADGGLFGDDAVEKIPITDACGVCPACRKAAIYAHPDIHYAYPTVGTNAVSTDFVKEWRGFLSETPYGDANTWLQRLGADNKQGNINKEECNAIIKKLSLKAFEGRYKILVMWLPEYLGKEGNRLLKLIEEPPEQTIFLLAAENQEMILNTILSRCQLIKTDLLSDDEVTAGLIQKRQLDEARARQIAFLAHGNLGTALELADNPENDDARLFLEWLRKCWRGQGVELVKWTDEVAGLGRENQKQFLQYGLHFLRELLVMVGTGVTELRLHPDELSTAHNMAKILTFEKIGHIATLLNDNVYYIERNANPKILFLDASIRIHHILKA
jgi:DNA polymerase III subunit delta'